MSNEFLQVNLKKGKEIFTISISTISELKEYIKNGYTILDID